MVKKFLLVLVLCFSGLFLTAEEAALKIADASRAGIRALNAAALRMALKDKTSVSIDRVTPQEALESFKAGKVDLIVLEHGNLPEKKPGSCRLFAAEVCAVYVHRESPLENVTRKELAEVFQKRRPSWNSLYPLKSTDIHRYTLKDKAPGYRLAESLLGADKFAADIFSVGSTRQMLLLMQDNPEALGIGLWLPSARQLKVLAVNGIKPTFENISSGRYLLCWRYYFLVRKDLSEPARRFLSSLRTPEFTKELEEFGFISL